MLLLSFFLSASKNSNSRLKKQKVLLGNVTSSTLNYTYVFLLSPFPLKYEVSPKDCLAHCGTYSAQHTALHIVWFMIKLVEFDWIKRTPSLSNSYLSHLAAFTQEPLDAWVNTRGSALGLNACLIHEQTEEHPCLHHQSLQVKRLVQGLAFWEEPSSLSGLAPACWGLDIFTTKSTLESLVDYIDRQKLH